MTISFIFCRIFPFRPPQSLQPRCTTRTFHGELFNLLSTRSATNLPRRPPPTSKTTKLHDVAETALRSYFFKRTRSTHRIAPIHHHPCSHIEISPHTSSHHPSTGENSRYDPRSFRAEGAKRSLKKPLTSFLRFFSSLTVTKLGIHSNHIISTPHTQKSPWEMF